MKLLGSLLLAFLLVASSCQSTSPSQETAPGTSSVDNAPPPPDPGTVEVEADIERCVAEDASRHACAMTLRRVGPYGPSTPVLGEGRTVTATVSNALLQARLETPSQDGMLRPGDRISATLLYRGSGATGPGAAPSEAPDGTWTVIRIES